LTAQVTLWKNQTMPEQLNIPEIDLSSDRLSIAVRNVELVDLDGHRAVVTFY
jgi:hypothetical protein